MNFWIGFWTAVLIFAVASLTGLAFVVTIGGFFDVKAMFKSIDSKHRVENSPES
jgi:hypothetical protein